MEIIKIAIITKNLENHGITNVLFNYLTKISKKKFDITIISGDNVEEYYYKKLIENGINVELICNKDKSKVNYYKELYNKLKLKKYDIVHLHGNSSFMLFELIIAKLCGVKERIAHCHNTSSSNDCISKILKPFFNKTYTYAIACSNNAGKWAFYENFHILNNSFETKKFKFNVKDRKRIREELGIKDSEFLIGHVGRANEQKNKRFLIDTFEKIYKENKKYKLLLIGEGPLYDESKNYVSELECKNNIIFIKNTNEIYKYYSAMDLFAFPSKYEGLGIVAVEAQISGLNTICSNCVPKDVILNQDYIKFLPLEEEMWVKEILSIEKINIIDRENYIENNADNIRKYEIDNTVKELENIYLSLYK